MSEYQYYEFIVIDEPLTCTSRKLVHLEILGLFCERCQRGIYGHRHRHRESKIMNSLIGVLLAFVSTVLRSRLALQLENVALRHQLTVYQRTTKRPRIGTGDRILWSWFSRHWPGWRVALVAVQPRTVIARQRTCFRDHWAKLSKQGMPCRPPLPKEVRALIRKIPVANSGWDSPRIVGELRKLGIAVPKPQLTIMLMFRTIE